MYKVFACARCLPRILGGVLWQRLVLAVHSLNLFSRVRSAAKGSMRLVPACSVLNIDSYGCASFHVERASMCHYASFQAPARARDELQLRAIFQRENSNAFLRHAIAARKQLDRAHDVH